MGAGQSIRRSGAGARSRRAARRQRIRDFNRATELPTGDVLCAPVWPARATPLPTAHGADDDMAVPPAPGPARVDIGPICQYPGGLTGRALHGIGVTPRPVPIAELGPTGWRIA